MRFDTYNPEHFYDEFFIEPGKPKPELENPICPHDADPPMRRSSRWASRVAEEDKISLEESGLAFNLHSIIGGQLEKDDEHKVYLIYPQGNWVEITNETPYQIIGEGGYGKPILDLGLNYNSSPITALKVGFLAFDATRRSATGVGFPIDVIYYKKNSFKFSEYQYDREEMQEVCAWWRENLTRSLEELPANWTNKVLPSFNTVSET